MVVTGHGGGGGNILVREILAKRYRYLLRSKNSLISSAIQSVNSAKARFPLAELTARVNGLC